MADDRISYGEVFDVLRKIETSAFNIESSIEDVASRAMGNTEAPQLYDSYREMRDEMEFLTGALHRLMNDVNKAVKEEFNDIRLAEAYAKKMATEINEEHQDASI